MGEPLFDTLTALIVLSGAAACVILSRSTATHTNNSATRWQVVVGQVLLGLAVSLLLWRWIDSFWSVASAGKTASVWLSSGLTAVCGIGIAGAVNALFGVTARARHIGFLTTCGCGVAAILLAQAWFVALASLTLLTGAAFAERWWPHVTALHHPRRLPGGEREPVTSDSSRPDNRVHEPTLLLATGVGLLVLLLGTWQHVLNDEVQRKTRSQRYSAWTRPRALENAWERTDMLPRPTDPQSPARSAQLSTREMATSAGLFALLLIVAGYGWRRVAVSDPDASSIRCAACGNTPEVDHAG